MPEENTVLVVCLKKETQNMENGRRGGFQEMLVCFLSTLSTLTSTSSLTFSHTFLVVQGMVMKRGGKEEKNNNKPLVTLHEEGSEERIKVANI